MRLFFPVDEVGRIILRGEPISPGIAIGPLVLAPDAIHTEKRKITEADIPLEIAALHKACEVAKAELERTILSIPHHLPELIEIIKAQMELMGDPRLLQNASGRIRHKKISAAWALSETINELCELFQDLDDAYLGARAEDIRGIGKSILTALSGLENRPESSANKVMAARELTPAELLKMEPASVQGLLTVEGAATSHIAILARGLKLPAVSGIPELLEKAQAQETVIVDGLRGLAILGPDNADMAHYQALRAKFTSFEQEALQAAETPAVTRDGIAITTLANLDRPQEVAELAKSGAEGIGLYRTEYSFLNQSLPDEEKLFNEYSLIWHGCNQKRVVFRAFDLGADKLPSSRGITKEPNPALGVRGIRLCLREENLFRSQLRAILQASAQNQADILLPMLTSLEELRKVKTIVTEIQSGLELNKIPFGSCRIGVMIETPAAVFISNELARESDFLSIGTNDLLHYIMAIDRNNRHVSYLRNFMHPAFLRSIKMVADAGLAHAKEVCVCGELASDPLGLPLLLGLGITSISAIPRFIPIIKQLARQLDTRQCAKIAQRAMAGEETEKTRKLLKGLLDEALVSDLLFPSYPITTRQSL